MGDTFLDHVHDECDQRIADLRAEVERLRAEITEMKERWHLSVNEHADAVRRESEAQLREVDGDEAQRLRTCGQHPTLGDVTREGSRACGRILPVAELYRCGDCQTAFCVDCLRRHCSDEIGRLRAELKTERACNVVYVYCPDCGALRTQKKNEAAAAQPKVST